MSLLFIKLAWGKTTTDNLDLKRARRILDQDHYGLEKVKERIIEYLAVLRMKQDMKGPILCFVGPPGVGKTSIVRAVAKAVGREFVQMSLGGVRDEAEIRGHRRTYVGAIPGRIISGIKQAGTMNPVFLFDEIDKMSSDFRGDPASALLEVLDAEQNFAFRDHYMELPFDLSKVMFITTANSMDTIPGPLLDRLEIIEVSSYTEEEKLRIARKHLLPKQIKQHGLKAGSVRMNDKLLKAVIEGYTREAGVRELERVLAKVVRKAVVEMLDETAETVTVTAQKLQQYLGAPRFSREQPEKTASETQRNAKIRSEMQHALSSVNNLSRLGATSTSSVLARVRQYVHGIEVVNDLNVSMYGEVGRLYDVSTFDNIYAIIDNYDSCLASGQKVNDALSKLTDAINELNTLTNAVLNNTSAADTAAE